MNRKNKKLLKLIGIHVLAVAVVIIMIFPVYWHVFSLFCKESFYRIWNCTLFMEQYLYYDRIHRSYTGSGLSGCFQL